MTEGSEGKKKHFFFMLKSVLKCMESIRIKKMGKKNSIFDCQLGGRGGGVRPSWSKANFLIFFVTLP